MPMIKTSLVKSYANEIITFCHDTKGGFFRKCDSFFRSPNLEKKIFQKAILNLKFKIPAHNIILFWAGILNFKFKICSFLEYFFFEIWRSKKRIALSEKKPPLMHSLWLLIYFYITRWCYRQFCSSSKF